MQEPKAILLSLSSYLFSHITLDANSKIVECSFIDRTHRIHRIHRRHMSIYHTLYLTLTLLSKTP